MIRFKSTEQWINDMVDRTEYSSPERREEVRKRWFLSVKRFEEKIEKYGSFEKAYPELFKKKQSGVKVQIFPSFQELITDIIDRSNPTPEKREEELKRWKKRVERVESRRKRQEPSEEFLKNNPQFANFFKKWE